MTASSTNTNDDGELRGKRVLITGGTKGAGKAIADRFLQGGATVAITARSAPPEGTTAHYIQADLSTSAGTSSPHRESRYLGPTGLVSLRSE
jgi:NAD(P)-dependent dehydrogenase (short-subunit alcohol dehydrogenase family)